MCMDRFHISANDLLTIVGRKDVDLSLEESKDTIHITITDRNISDSDEWEDRN